MDDGPGRTGGGLGDSFIGLLSDRMDRTRRHLEILVRTIVEVSSASRPKVLRETILDQAIEVAGADRGFLLLPDRRGELRVEIARDRDGNPISPEAYRSRSVPEEVAKDGKVIAMTDLSGAGDLDSRDSITLAKLRNILCGPLRVRGRTIGVLYVDSLVHAKRFTDADRGLFKALCYEMAFALELANLAEKEQSLAIARGIQERLLPAPGPRLPGLDLHGVSVPWEEVGGDYFDYLPLGPSRLGLVLGDVTGHGIGAALLMATCRSLVRTIASLEPDLPKALTLANDHLHRELADNEFLSLCLIDADVERHEIRYVRAGHASPLHLHGDTGKLSTYGHRAPPLSVIEGREYRLEGPVPVRPGDLLVLYTDGVEEARRGNELFGEERAREAVLELRDLPARGIAEKLVERVLEFGAGGGIKDDVTVVVARFTG